MELLNRTVQSFERFQARRRDASRNDPPIFLFAASSHQSAAFQAIDQAGDVGVTIDHALADLAAGQPFRPRTAEDAQRVVLGRREPMLLQHLGPAPCQLVGGAHQRHEHLFLQATEGLGLLDFGLNPPSHISNILVITTIVKGMTPHGESGLVPSWPNQRLSFPAALSRACTARTPRAIAVPMRIPSIGQPSGARRDDKPDNSTRCQQDHISLYISLLSDTGPARISARS